MSELAAKAKEECRKNPSNCDECPFSDKEKMLPCIDVIAEVVRERTEEYNRKYHPYGGGIPTDSQN